MTTNSGLGRRQFLSLSATALAGLALAKSSPAAFAADLPLADGLPARPAQEPLNWRARGDAFNDYVMEPRNGVLRKRADGTFFFASALEGTGDGGLTTFAPILLGKILRGEAVDSLVASMPAYFSEKSGMFLDGVDAELCEYWYLMNVNALAGGIVRSHLSHDEAWTGRVRKSADRLIELAQQISYNFNDQGYKFNTNAPFTNKDIYRQPDTIGGYGYLMLLAHEMFGDERYLKEARKALKLYQSFSQNPWYEVPSGAMAALAAARLSTQEKGIDVRRVLSFVLDEGGHPLQTGKWGDMEVNGLMAGFSTEPAGQAYSMESLVVLSYLLPVLRYRPEYAEDIGRYLLNTAANMRLFYSDCMPRKNQSRPELTSAVPYERLTKEVNGQSPYASGDYGSHRSIYGGAYALWWGELVRPTREKFILQMDIARTDFLCEKSFPSYLYYNPWPRTKHIELTLAGEASDIYDLTQHKFIQREQKGRTVLAIPGNEARIVIVIPSGSTRNRKDGMLTCGEVVVDYKSL